MCVPQHTENKNSSLKHSRRNGRGSNWQNCEVPNWYYVHLRCPGYNFCHKGQEVRARVSFSIRCQSLTLDSMLNTLNAS